MSYRTQKSTLFPAIPTTQNFRSNQEFDALHVEDPRARRREIPRTPPNGGRKSSRDQDRDRDRDRSDSKFDMLASQQDMLLKNQMQVAQNQDELARRLNDQSNQMTSALIQRVIGNKDSMIANLQQQQGLEWEQHMRDLFQQHLQIITAIVHRLNLDIEALESELRGRDIAVVGTNKAVNKLEVHHVTMLHDLKARIARCDAAVSKHSKDLILLMEEIRRLEGQQIGTREKLINDIHRLEAEVMSFTGELERQAGEQRSELSHFRSDTTNRLNNLEDRSKANFMELRDMIEGNRVALNGYVDRLDTKFTSMINKATDGWANIMNQVDQKIADGIYALDERIQKVESSVGHDRARMKDIEKSITYNIMAAIKENFAYQDDLLAKTKQEFREGFRELQESIDNLKVIVEGRRKIMGRKLGREIGKVKNTMFIEMPPSDGTLAIAYPTYQK